MNSDPIDSPPFDPRGFETIDTLSVDPQRARVYEHGWQSWSPSADYPVTATSYRPVTRHMDTMAYRPGRPGPPRGFQGEGLLAVDFGDGTTRVYATPGPEAVPSIRAAYAPGALRITADGPVDMSTYAGPMQLALGMWADGYASKVGVPAFRTAPAAWCTWYQYYGQVSAADVEENAAAVADAALPVDVVQIDDGWQAEIGDWLTYSDRFAALHELVDHLRESGLRAGIWIAPFLVGSRSELLGAHPEWLVGGTDSPAAAGHNWAQDLYALDPTHPGAAGYLRSALANLIELGFTYIKLDFLYAGALDGQRADGSPALAAYRHGLELIRAAVGPDVYLLGSGAPILPSVGLLDAMRVSSDIAVHYHPADGDPSRPSQLGAALSTIGRAFQHGRFWVNDPDCLLARPGVERREDWAKVVERYGGLRCSGDRIAELDDWGLSTTKRLLSTVPPPVPFTAG
jgi:alpha-galactosidase